MHREKIDRAFQILMVITAMSIWGVSCSSDTSTSVTEQETYSLSVEIKGRGEVKESQLSGKSTDYVDGSMVELMAVPDEEWEFIRWEGDIEGTSNPATISISSNSTVTAIFQHEDVKVEIEGEGDVDVEILDENEKFKRAERRARLTATPENGWQFVSWEGDVTGSENPIEFFFEEELNVDAVFISKGAKWQAVKTFTKRIFDIYFINETNGWATVGTQESPAKAIYRTTNGGISWDLQYSGNWQLTDIKFADENKGWATGIDLSRANGDSSNDPLTGVILHTDDGGQNWEEQLIFEGSCACSNSPITVLNRDEVWVSGFDDEDFLDLENDGLLLRTTNGGQTWQEIEIYKENQENWVRFTSLVFSDSNTGWLNGTPVSFKTNDGGNSWNPTNQDYGMKDFVNRTVGWGVRGVNADTLNIFQTVDGGNSWMLISNIHDFVDFNSFFEMDFVNSRLGWGATNKGIIHTIDGGVSWQLQDVSSSNGVDTFVRSVQLINSQRGFAVTFGDGTLLRYVPK